MSDSTVSSARVFAVIALGSNVGSKRKNISDAVTALSRVDGVEVIKRSRDFKTPPWGDTDQDWFVNACIGVMTTLGAHELLARCLETERSMGRSRGKKWGPRVIDLDILIYGDLEIRDSDLVVPHPYITQRAFVLAPLSDVAPDVVLNGKTVTQWLNSVSLEGIEPFD